MADLQIYPFLERKFSDRIQIDGFESHLDIMTTTIKVVEEGFLG